MEMIQALWNYVYGQKRRGRILDNYQLVDVQPSELNGESGQMDPVALLLDADSKKPVLQLKPVKESKAASTTLGVAASVGQAASTGAALWRQGQLYELIVTDPNLLAKILQGTAEFVPGKIAGTISSQIRDVAGPAIGTGLLKQAGSAINCAVGMASICGAIASIAMEMRMQAIEAKLDKILETVQASINIELTSRLDRAVEECRELLKRIAAVELSCEQPAADVLLLQRTDLDRRIYDIQKTAEEVAYATQAWLAKELHELSDAGAGDAAPIVERLKQMWNIRFKSLKLCVMSRHVEREKERLRGGSNMANFLERNFSASCTEMQKCQEWLDEVNSKLGAISGKQAWYQKVWNFVTGRNQKLGELIAKHAEFSKNAESEIQDALLCTAKLPKSQPHQRHQPLAAGDFSTQKRVIRGRFDGKGIFQVDTV